VRAAALRLLGNVGKDNPKAFSVFSDTLTKAFDTRDFTLGVASAEALVGLGDPRGLAVLDQIRKSASNPHVIEMLGGFRDHLQKAPDAGIPVRRSRNCALPWVNENYCRFVS
jgi:hypothetical protein